jgi:hypothetical protein
MSRLRLIRQLTLLVLLGLLLLGHVQSALASTGPGPVASIARASAAVDWARDQVGDVYTRSNRYASYWSGYCEAFVEAAYRYTFDFYSAWDDYKAQQRAGRVHRGVPPRGALVFYKDVPYGHVALSLGHGLVVSTIGFDNQRLPVAIEPYRWFTAAYMGWAAPPAA